jgi:hypothetical protein
VARLSWFRPSGEGVVAFGFADKRNPEVPKMIGPQVLVGGHIREKSKGGVRDPLSFSGFRIEETGGLTSGITKSRNPNTLSGEGCGHISDHVGESWRLVLVCTGITHKDLWIHTSVCEISVGKSKSQSDSRGRLRMILRPGGHAEPAEVGVLRQSGIRAYNICFCL